MNIAVFMGGSSPERQVSLASGKAVVEGLRQAGHRVTPFDVEWLGSRSLLSAVESVMDGGFDLVFLILHGGLGENGGVQALLETAGLIYTGSGVAASAVAMDKDFSKHLFARHGIPTAPWIGGRAEDMNPDRIARELGWPCIVKPSDQGSTVGLSLVNGPSDLPEAVAAATGYADKIIAEAYLSGAELTVPIVAGQALPVIEIRPSRELYDYECKYTPGMTEYLVPAPVSADFAARLQELALRVWRVLDLRDVARIDFRLDAEGEPRCLEANTLPGMTATSLVPKSARAAGIEFPELVSRIAASAMCRKGR